MPAVVVARFNEPLDWLSAVPEDWSVYVYNKGGQVDVAERCRLTEVANVGREAETFCRHNATVEPDDWTVYLQGNPFDHCPDPIGTAVAFVEAGNSTGWLGESYETSWNAAPHTLVELGAAATWSMLFPGLSMPWGFTFPAGAQMVVRRDRVQARPKWWWRLAHEVSSSSDWRVAHCFERFWPTIYA